MNFQLLSVGGCHSYTFNLTNVTLYSSLKFTCLKPIWVVALRSVNRWLNACDFCSTFSLSLLHGKQHWSVSSTNFRLAGISVPILTMLISLNRAMGDICLYLNFIKIFKSWLCSKQLYLFTILVSFPLGGNKYSGTVFLLIGVHWNPLKWSGLLSAYWSCSSAFWKSKTYAIENL